MRGLPVKASRRGPVCIAHAYLWHEAHLMLNALRSAGLPVWLEGAEIHSMLPEAGLALGGMRLMVAAAREEEARACLADLPLPVMTALPRPATIMFAALTMLGLMGVLPAVAVAPAMNGFYPTRPSREARI